MIGNLITLRAMVLSILLIMPFSGRAQNGKASTVNLNNFSLALQALSERIEPAVVQIYTTGYTAGIPGSMGLLVRQNGGGSGVLMSPEGYIVTNAHVVDGAGRIQVNLPGPEVPGSPGRSVLKVRGKLVGAQLVGVDHPTDVAVLKIQGGNFPHLKFADSESLRSGQPVMAFGSPLGLGNTVTFGVISAVARQLEPDAPMIYIQTDAPINPGNSGGPLVNMDGDLVGINTFILSQSGGNEGLGFAAPSNIVKNVFEQIRTTGRMRRGFIGVNAQTITPLLAQGLGLDRTWGVILGDVHPDGPAQAMGLLPGDIILSLNGKIMENGRQLQVNLYSRRIGESVDLELLRYGETLTIRVPVVEHHEDPGRFAALVTPIKNLVPELGILGIDLNENLIKMIPSLREKAGVVVAAMSGSAPPGSKGLMPGDVIHRVNGKAIPSLSALKELVDSLPRLDPVVLHVERQGQKMYVVMEIE